MANRGMGRGSARRTTLGVAMDALVMRAAAARREAEAPVTAAAEAGARAELLCRSGVIDAHPNGERRSYAADVAGEACRAFVCALGDCLLVAFLVPGRPLRKLLVAPGRDGRPRCWLHRREDGPAFFPHGGKYARAANTLTALRAFEAERGGAARAA